MVGTNAFLRSLQDLPQLPLILALLLLGGLIVVACRMIVQAYQEWSRYRHTDLYKYLRKEDINERSPWIDATNNHEKGYTND